MARRNQGLDADSILQQLCEVSSGSSGSGSDSESDLDTFSLHTPVDTSDSESDDEIGGILLGCPRQAPQLQGSTVRFVTFSMSYMLIHGKKPTEECFCPIYTRRQTLARFAIFYAK